MSYAFLASCLNKAIDRKADKLGLAADRRDFPIVRQLVRMIMMIPLVPADRAGDAVEVSSKQQMLFLNCLTLYVPYCFEGCQPALPTVLC